VLTNPENRTAPYVRANPLTQNRFAMMSHRPQTGLDIGTKSWQVRNSWFVGDLLKVAAGRSVASNSRSPHPLPPSRENFTTSAGS